MTAHTKPYGAMVYGSVSVEVPPRLNAIFFEAWMATGGHKGASDTTINTWRTKFHVGVKNRHRLEIAHHNEVKKITRVIRKKYDICFFQAVLLAFIDKTDDEMCVAALSLVLFDTVKYNFTQVILECYDITFFRPRSTSSSPTNCP